MKYLQARSIIAVVCFYFLSTTTEIEKEMQKATLFPAGPDAE
jgi:hypothetical protein